MEPCFRKKGLNLNLNNSRAVIEDQNFSHFLFSMKATSVHNLKQTWRIVVSTIWWFDMELHITFSNKGCQNWIKGYDFDVIIWSIKILPAINKEIGYINQMRLKKLLKKIKNDKIIEWQNESQKMIKR